MNERPRNQISVAAVIIVILLTVFMLAGVGFVGFVFMRRAALPADQSAAVVLQRLHTSH
jgi:flagellar basal body-associated protein FliL